MSDQNNAVPKSSMHEKIETSNFLLIALTLFVLTIGGLVEIVPLFFQKSTTEAVAGLKPYTPLQLMGRDVYLREGCYNCHSQMIRPFRAETMRYGHNPRDVVPESNMPAYPWLEATKVDDSAVATRMSALRKVGVPYTDAEIAGAQAEVKDKTEMEAVISYLQVLGRAVK